MIQRTVKEYIQIGTCIRYLQDAKEGYSFHKKGCIIQVIQKLILELDQLNLNVTKRASVDLVRFLEKAKLTAKTATINTTGAKNLNRLAANLRLTLQAETDGIIASIITDKKYTIEKLLDIGQLFDAGIFARLSDLAKYDFSEAGQCIAFERTTAAAFHVLRGTEEVLKHYYIFYIPNITGFRTWGQMTNDLQEINNGNRPKRVIVDHLKNIGQNFRNPTQHPDMIYDIEEVQNLLALCLDVVNRMIKEI